MQRPMAGELGKLRSVAVRVRWCRPQRYYDLAPWRGTFAMDGGCLPIRESTTLTSCGASAER